MSASSNEDRDSIARKTSQSRNSHVFQTAVSTSMENTTNSPNLFLGAEPVQKKDHRRYDKERPKPYLDWNDFLSYMDEHLE
jgi:hypothetical protein